jgi:hypothetical protein
MLKAASIVDIDTFIEHAAKIADRVKRHPDLSKEAKREAHILLEQLEGYLEANGLKVSDNTES